MCVFIECLIFTLHWIINIHVLQTKDLFVCFFFFCNLGFCGFCAYIILFCIFVVVVLGFVFGFDFFF